MIITTLVPSAEKGIFNWECSSAAGLSCVHVGKVLSFQVVTPTVWEDKCSESFKITSIGLIYIYSIKLHQIIQYSVKV